VAERHPLQDPKGDAGPVERGARLEQETFDPEGVRQPRLEELLDALALGLGDEEGAVPHRGRQQAEQAVALAVVEEPGGGLVVEGADPSG
jgi:hypothetical protein